MQRKRGNSHWRAAAHEEAWLTSDDAYCTLLHTLHTLVYSCTLLHKHVVHIVHLHTIANSCKYVVPTASAHSHKLDTACYKLKLTKPQHCKLHLKRLDWPHPSQMMHVAHHITCCTRQTLASGASWHSDYLVHCAFAHNTYYTGTSWYKVSAPQNFILQLRILTTSWPQLQLMQT